MCREHERNRARAGGRATRGDRHFRLERALGFREPEGYNLATRAFFVVIILAVLVLAVLSAMRAETLALALVRLAPFGLLVALIPQAAGDFFYRKNRKLSAVLRVVARIAVTPALLVVYTVLAYAAYGAWATLILAGLFCTMFSVALLLSRISGPRPGRGGRVRSEVTSGDCTGADQATRFAFPFAAPLPGTGGSWRRAPGVVARRSGLPGCRATG